VPILNRFVTRTSTVREQDNLLILVTPRIIIQEEGERSIQ
jgi:Flp pilus assembly secretin CpaC